MPACGWFYLSSLTARAIVVGCEVDAVLWAPGKQIHKEKNRREERNPNFLTFFMFFSGSSLSSAVICRNHRLWLWFHQSAEWARRTLTPGLRSKLALVLFAARGGDSFHTAHTDFCWSKDCGLSKNATAESWFSLIYNATRPQPDTATLCELWVGRGNLSAVRKTAGKTATYKQDPNSFLGKRKDERVDCVETWTGLLHCHWAALGGRPPLNAKHTLYRMEFIMRQGLILGQLWASQYHRCNQWWRLPLQKTAIPAHTRSNQVIKEVRHLWQWFTINIWPITDQRRALLLVHN